MNKEEINFSSPVKVNFDLEKNSQDFLALIPTIKEWNDKGLITGICPNPPYDMLVFLVNDIVREQFIQECIFLGFKIEKPEVKFVDGKANSGSGLYEGITGKLPPKEAREYIENTLKEIDEEFIVTQNPQSGVLYFGAKMITGHEVLISTKEWKTFVVTIDERMISIGSAKQYEKHMQRLMKEVDKIIRNSEHAS